jgi:uncharacterized protein (DUF983 family)
MTVFAPTPFQRVTRGLTLRCPECGTRGMLNGWFKLQPACARCGLLFDRGSHDYFIGAYLINLIASELIFAIGLGIWLLRTWPNIPWDTLQYVAIAIMIVAPVFTYPFTKSTWLAVDLVFQPPTPKDRGMG